MMDHVSIVADAFGVFSLLLFFAGVCLFLADPVKRWVLFGYRPTAVLVLCDPERGTLLLHRKRRRADRAADDEWSFIQGGAYGKSIDQSVLEILARELGGFRPERYSLRYYKPFGTIRVDDTYRSKRSTGNTLSLRRRIIGKGWLGCFLFADLSDLAAETRPGFDIAEVATFPLAEARVLLQRRGQLESPEGRKKARIFSLMLDELEILHADRVALLGGGPAAQPGRKSEGSSSGAGAQSG